MSEKKTTSHKPLVVITGASSGIGAETAKVFSKAGHALLLLSRRVAKMQALKLPNCMCEKADVTNMKQVQAAIDKAEKAYGPAIGLINNAGLMLLGDVATQPMSEWDKMNQVNIHGVMNCTRAVLPGMKKRKSGIVINISSIAGQKSFPNHAAYCGTKFAVRSITECLREEYSNQGVKFISICPGVVETELLGHQSNKEILSGYEQWKKTMKLGCLKAVDVANSIYFAFNQPKHVLIREITISPAEQTA